MNGSPKGRDTHSETGGPARLDAQVDGRWGQRNINGVLGRLEQPRQNKNRLYWHDNPNEPTKEGPLSFVLFESPLTSILTVSRGHPSLVSMVLGG